MLYKIIERKVLNIKGQIQEYSFFVSWMPVKCEISLWIVHNFKVSIKKLFHVSLLK